MTVLPVGFDYLNFFDWIWQTSARVSVLIIFLLLLKFILKSKISARLHYLLWSIVVISLLLPWVPQSSFSLYNLTWDGQKMSSFNGGVKIPSHSATMDSKFPRKESDNRLNQIAVATPYIPSNTDEPLNSIDISPFTHRLLFSIWIIGIVVLITVTGLINRKFIRRIQGQSVVNVKLLMAFEVAKNNLNIKTEVPLIQTMAITSPSLFGLFRPRLLIPASILEEFNAEQLKHIFVHELSHLKRNDVLLNWLLQGLLILHWFNPILWYAFYKLREDQEISCDAITLEHIGINDSKEYAYTLIKLAESNLRTPKIVSLAGLLGSSSQIRRRITMIKTFRKKSLKWSLLVIIIAAALASVTLTNARQTAAKNDPPLLSEEKAVDVINSFLPTTAQVVTPQNPEGAKGIQLADLNGDRKDEIVALYKLSGEQSGAGLLVLAPNPDGSWHKILDYKSEGYGVNYFKSADITGDQKNDIVVGWNIGAIANSMDIFSFESNQPKKIASDYYSKIETEDMMNESGKTNGKSELALWNHDTGEAFKIDVLEWDGEKLVSDQDVYPYYFKKVTQYYEQKVKEMPDAAFYWYYLADAQIKANNPKAALASITTGLSIKDKHTDYYPDNSKFEDLKIIAQNMLNS